MRKQRTTSGYTIVEIMVAMLAGVLVLGGIYQLLTQNQRVYKTTSQLVETQQLVRTAMDIMTRDIRQAGSDQSKTVFGGDAADNTYGVPLKNADAISVQMDLPRDANGDGDEWDIVDISGNGSIDYGCPGTPADPCPDRFEDEFGDGIIGDANPDEWVTYFYCADATSQAGTQDIDGDAGDDVTCPANETLRLYRMVSYFDDTSDTLQLLTEPLADYIEPDLGVPLFEYLCPTATCNLANAKPQVVKIVLRGRTRDPDPQDSQYKYFQLEAQVRLMNLGVAI